MPGIGYCNSLLINKNIDYNFPLLFLILGFNINHCVNCVIVVMSCGSQFFFLSINFSLFILEMPNKWYQILKLKDLRAKDKYL